MPATEQTWRDQKQMHVIFAISSVIMLVATVWMLAVDHARSWKPYQQQIRSIELAMTDMRKIQHETEEAEGERERLAAQIRDRTKELLEANRLLLETQRELLDYKKGLLI